MVLMGVFCLIHFCHFFVVFMFIVSQMRPFCDSYYDVNMLVKSTCEFEIAEKDSNANLKFME